MKLEDYKKAKILVERIEELEKLELDSNPHMKVFVMNDSRQMYVDVDIDSDIYDTILDVFKTTLNNLKEELEEL